MNTIDIRLSTIQEVQKFVNIVNRYEIDVDLASGRYIVDAKSIMGIFSLDLLKPITVTAHTDNADELFAELKEFAV